MSNNKKLLRNLLTTASLFAVVAGGATNAVAAPIQGTNLRHAITNPATSDGKHFTDLNVLVGAGATDPMADGDILNTNGVGQITMQNAALNNLSVIVSGNNSKMTVNKAGFSFNSIVGVDGKTLNLEINADTTIGGALDLDQAQSGLAGGITKNNFSGIGSIDLKAGLVTADNGGTFTTVNFKGGSLTQAAAAIKITTVNVEGDGTLTLADVNDHSIGTVNLNAAKTFAIKTAGKTIGVDAVAFTANGTVTVTGAGATIKNVTTNTDNEGTVTLNGAADLGAVAVPANGANPAVLAQTIGADGKALLALNLQGNFAYNIHADVFAKTINANNGGTNLVLDNAVTLNGDLTAANAGNGVVTIGNANSATTNSITGNIGAAGNAWSAITFNGNSMLNLAGTDFNVNNINMPALIKNAQTLSNEGVRVAVHFTEDNNAVQYKGTIAPNNGQNLSLNFDTRGAVVITGNIGGNAATDIVSLINATNSSKLTLTGDVYVANIFAPNIAVNAGTYMFGNTSSSKITLGGNAKFAAGTNLGNATVVLAANTATLSDKVDLNGLTFDAVGGGSLVFDGKSTYNSTQGNDPFTSVTVNAGAQLTLNSVMNATQFKLAGAASILNLNSALTVGAKGLVDGGNAGAAVLNLGNNASVTGALNFTNAGSTVTVLDGASATLDQVTQAVITLGGNGANLTITGATTAGQVTLKTSGNNTDAVVLGANYENKVADVGAVGKAFKSITLTNNTTLDFTNKAAYVQSFITNTDGAGSITWGNAEITNVGTAGAKFKTFTLTADSNVAKTGSIYAGTLALASKTLTVNSGGSVIVDNATTAAANNGVVTFVGNGTFAGNFGIKGTELAAFNINGGRGTVVSGSGNIHAAAINQAADSTFVLTGDTVLNGVSTLGDNATVNLVANNLTYSALTFGANDTYNLGVTLGGASSGNVTIQALTAPAATTKVNVTVTDARSIKEVMSSAPTVLITATGPDAANAANALTKNSVVTVSNKSRFVTYNPDLTVEHKAGSVDLTASVTSTFNADFSGDMKKLGAVASTKAFTDAMAQNPEAYVDMIEVFGHMEDKDYVDSVQRVQAPSSVVSTVAIDSVVSAIGQAASRASAVASGDSDVKAGLWAQGFFGRGTQNARKTDVGFKSDTSGATVGVDAELNDNALIGISATMARTNVKMKDYLDGDKTKVESLMLSVYGALNFAGNYVVEGAASFGNSKVKNTNKRVFTTGGVNAKSKFDGTSYGVKALVGYNYKVSEATTLTPMVGLEYARFDAGNATETGAGVQNRKISVKQLDKMTGLFGARMNTNFDLADMAITPEVHVFGGYDFKAANPKSTVTLASNGAPIPVANAKAARTSFNVGMSVTAKYDMMEYGVGYDAKISDKYFGHQGSLKVRVNF